jgi:hypothetical protein
MFAYVVIHKNHHILDEKQFLGIHVIFHGVCNMMMYLASLNSGFGWVKCLVPSRVSAAHLIAAIAQFIVTFRFHKVKQNSLTKRDGMDLRPNRSSSNLTRIKATHPFIIFGTTTCSKQVLNIIVNT